MNVRTSESDPLRIDAVPCGAGLIGMTTCPGKQSESYYGRPWLRSLDTDLDAIVAWGATALVTLIEDHEFTLLRIPTLGPEAVARGLDWHHLPIPDTEAPGPAFERLWPGAGVVLRRRLSDGEKIVLHCRGGLGRTGTVAALLLIEFGQAPNTAISAVRAARRGTIENRTQEQYVRGYSPGP